TTIMQQTDSPLTGAADIVCAAANAWRQAVSDLQADGFDSFRQRFESVDALAGRDVNVIDQGKVLFSGVARGLDEHGRLQVQTADGLRPIAVGEISIRARAAEHAP